MVEGADDPFNEGAAAIGKDGSMVLMKNSNIFQGSLQPSPTPAKSNKLGEAQYSPQTYQGFGSPLAL